MRLGLLCPFESVPAPQSGRAASLLRACQRELQVLENYHGRERGERWGARTLDLDILLYGNDVLNSDDLTIPHPRLGERNFVLYPLFDQAPDLTLPCGTPIASLLARCPRTGLRHCLSQDQET